MKRDLAKLDNTIFDLIVVGGGISGAFVSWIGTKAGKKVALVEQGDFAHATSANSQKIIHGGLRYLQNLDFKRVFQSIRARSRLMWLAPHLVHPLRCAMPIYGHSLKGKEAMTAGISLYNIISQCASAISDISVRLPNAKIVDKKTMLNMLPGIEARKLVGGAVWYEGVCQNTERLVLALIKSACRLGAFAANYTEAVKFRELNDGTVVVTCRDKLSQQKLDLKAKRVINCIGPWHTAIMQRIDSASKIPEQNFAAGLNLVTKPIFGSHTAIGLTSAKSAQSRLFFILPWRNRSIIGTEWFKFNGPVDELSLTEKHCRVFIDKFNAAYPPAKLNFKDVTYAHWGLVPCQNRIGNGTGAPNLSKKPRIIDVSKNGQARILNVIGIKYTTAEELAREVFNFIGTDSRKNISGNTKLVGGEVDDYDTFRSDAIAKWRDLMGEKEIDRLLTNYGTEVEDLIDVIAQENKDFFGYISKDMLIKAEILFAVRHEMALQLSDVVFRRTDWGTAGIPSDTVLTKIAMIMSEELKWSNAKFNREIEDVKEAYPPFIG